MKTGKAAERKIGGVLADELAGDRAHGQLPGRRGVRPSSVAMARVERLLAEQAEAHRAPAPPDLRIRIHESLREVPRYGQSMPIPGMVWRPLLGIAAAACLVGMLTLAGTLVLRQPPEGAVHESGSVAAQGGSGGLEAILSPEALPEPEEIAPRRVVDRGPVILPAGRLIVSRVEAPLRQEVDLLRRDTQRATEFVLSSLPFGGGR